MSQQNSTPTTPAGEPAWGTPSSPSTPSGPVGGPAWGTPRPGGSSGTLMRADEERNWAVAAHLSGFVAAYVALGFLGPLVVLLLAGNRSRYVREQAVEALNFNISVLIYIVASFVLMLVLIGFPMIIAVGVLYLVASIRGAMAAARGEDYRYPFTIRFISA